MRGGAREARRRLTRAQRKAWGSKGTVKKGQGQGLGSVDGTGWGGGKPHDSNRFSFEHGTDRENWFRGKGNGYGLGILHSGRFETAVLYTI